MPAKTKPTDRARELAHLTWTGVYSVQKDAPVPSTDLLCWVVKILCPDGPIHHVYFNPKTDQWFTS